jgi:sialic acid synthase SpsE
MKVEIIAEIGWNHMGNMNLAKKMIDEASSSGADTIKFQYWDPKNLKPGKWDQDGRREIYNKAFLNYKKIELLRSYVSKKKKNFLISVFGTIGAKAMKKINLNSIKIPSHEVANRRLIHYVSKNFKKIYFSTGASNEKEVIKANKILSSKKNIYYNLLHCVSAYPCEISRVNLTRINWLKNFTTNVGFSDHTSSVTIPAIAVGLGVTVIEKHFTVDNKLPGRDNKFAFNPKQFSEMVINIRDAEKSLKDLGKNYQSIEKDIVKNYRGRWEPKDYK